LNSDQLTKSIITFWVEGCYACYGYGNNNFNNFGGNQNYGNNNNDFNNRNQAQGGRQGGNEVSAGVGGNSLEHQLMGTLKSLYREKRDDLHQALREKIKDRNKVDQILNSLLEDGYILEEDDCLKIVQNL
jgi:hypothetical protein